LIKLLPGFAGGGNLQLSGWQGIAAGVQTPPTQVLYWQFNVWVLEVKSTLACWKWIWFLKISVGQNYVNAKILAEAHFCLLHTSAKAEVAKTFSLGSQNLEQRRSSGQHLDQKNVGWPNFNKL
jgi:hypothetical protein